MTQSARAAAQPPRRVLLTNDDGPDSAGSPFLRHWIEHVQRVLRWNCCVCIPASGQSFVSKSISRGPVKARLCHDQPSDPKDGGVAEGRHLQSCYARAHVALWALSAAVALRSCTGELRIITRLRARQPPA